MRRLLTIVSALTITALPALRAQDKPIDVPIGSDKYRLIGKLNEPLGTVLTLQGVVVDGPYKGYEGGPNLRVQRINGRATQEDIQIKLEPYFHEFGEKTLIGGKALPKLEFGQTYEFEGYETGHFVGVPKEAYKRAGLMLQVRVGLGFTHRFTVYDGKEVDGIRWSPADFVDREAMVEGRAVSRDRKAYIAGDGWRSWWTPSPRGQRVWRTMQLKGWA